MEKGAKMEPRGDRKWWTIRKMTCQTWGLNLVSPKIENESRISNSWRPEGRFLGSSGGRGEDLSSFRLTSSLILHALHPGGVRRMKIDQKSSLGRPGCDCDSFLVDFGPCWKNMFFLYLSGGSKNQKNRSEERPGGAKPATRIRRPDLSLRMGSHKPAPRATRN